MNSGSASASRLRPLASPSGVEGEALDTNERYRMQNLDVAEPVGSRPDPHLAGSAVLHPAFVFGISQASSRQR
ncbi:hypothetical protein [Phyllobacterium sp. OV277]|uniref:hypothetical protein n=1 Tax=Phyllobacterium sp. OV277 TaxID=1882772 RepID=UPI000A9B905F|nr:hypothetical protein [Phyllobacterium sp. OV277]